MRGEFTILVADRNRHVREFLRREFMAEGYRVLLAKDGREVSKMINMSEPPDLLILDLEIPYAAELQAANWPKVQNHTLPVIFHTFPSEYERYPRIKWAGAFVEKCANSIDLLKIVVEDLLSERYPNRFKSGKKATNEITRHERISGMDHSQITSLHRNPKR